MVLATEEVITATKKLSKPLQMLSWLPKESSPWSQKVLTCHFTKWQFSTFQLQKDEVTTVTLKVISATTKMILVNNKLLSVTEKVIQVTKTWYWPMKKCSQLH